MAIVLHDVGSSGSERHFDARLRSVVSAPWRQLLKDAAPLPFRLFAFQTIKATFEQMDRGIGGAADRSQINAARRPAPRAFYLQPWKTAVTDRWRWLGGAPVAPHFFVPALTQARLSASLISLAGRALLIGALARATVSSFACAFRSPPDSGVG
jgi:hypothetical protein